MNSQILMSVVCAAALALSGFGLKEIYDLNAKMAVLQADVNDDKRVNSSISKFWKLHGWAKDEINDLRHHAGKKNARWPDLGTRPESD